MRAFRYETSSGLVPLITGKNPIQVSIPLSKLFLNEVETPYQRNPERRLSWLKKNIGKKFSMDETGVFYVSHRTDDRYAIMDGGGRWYVMTYLLPQYKDVLVRCLVWEGLTIEEEAQIFAAQRNKKNISPADYFNSDVHRKVPEAVEIKDVMDELGLKVGSSWPKGISSVPYLYAIYRMGHLRRTVYVLKNTCNFRLTNIAIVSTAIFIDAAGRGLKEESLRSILSKNGPNYFEAKVKADAGGLRLHPQDLYGAVAKTMLRSYNSKVKTGKIELERIEKSTASFASKMERSSLPP